MIRTLEAKGIAGARATINELVSGGALTDYDAAKYMARGEVMKRAASSTSSTYAIVEEVAYLHSVSVSTLARVCGVK